MRNAGARGAVDGVRTPLASTIMITASNPGVRDGKGGRGAVGGVARGCRFRSGVGRPGRFRGSGPGGRAALGSIRPVTDTTPRPLKILVYSHDVNVREQVILALGRRPHRDLGEFTYVEVATEPVVIQNMDAGQIDLVILDGEAVPAGGLGIAKQLKDEIFNCPPVVVLIARAQDAWLATWSRAEAAVARPVDPAQLVEAVTSLLVDRVPAKA